MRNILNSILNSAIAIVSLAVLFFVKMNYFEQIPYFIHFSMYVLSMLMIYLFVQPTLMQALKKYRKRVIHVVTLITFVLSFLWNAEHAYFFYEEFNFPLYFIPIILSALFLSLKTGIAITAAASLSHTLVNVFIYGFYIDYFVTGLLQFMTFGLALVIITHVMKQRDRMLNKRDILVQESNALVMGMNSEGKIDVCNKRMMEFLGMEEKDIFHQYFWKVQKSIHNKEALKILNVLQEEKDHENDELEIDIENEKCSFILDSYTLEDDGLINGKMIVLTNITERKKMEQKLRELSVTDELTGIYNRRYFETKFAEEIVRSERYNHPLSLIMVDLDHFKTINDTYGHLAGDQVLKAVSNVLSDSIRMTDTCARIGGEEFAVLLPETDNDEAFDVARRIHQNIKAAEISIVGGALHVTASLGVTSHSTKFNIRDMIDEADKALYTAKENGRDQIGVKGEFAHDSPN